MTLKPSVADVCKGVSLLCGAFLIMAGIVDIWGVGGGLVLLGFWLLMGGLLTRW